MDYIKENIMSRIKRSIALVFAVLVSFSTLSGCGYSTKMVLPDYMQKVYVPNFENAIEINDRYTYVSGLEADITNAVIDRVLYDGSMTLVKEDEADVILKGRIKRYEQEGVRFNDTEDIQEYRLFVVVEFQLVRTDTGEVIIEEQNFTGDAEYFIEGANAVSERQAADSAIEDLAKNIVDRIVEDW